MYRVTHETNKLKSQHSPTCDVTSFELGWRSLRVLARLGLAATAEAVPRDRRTVRM